MKLKKIKALALLSGGLDSLLAGLLVQKQGIQITCLGFKSLFFVPHILNHRGFNPPVKIIDVSLGHLKIVKKPQYGYGKNANPCLDCHLLMLKEAKKIMQEQKYDFIVTGEVLGQRPFSQNKNSLALLERESDLQGLIIRPLSGQLLPVTLPEKKGWIKKNQLLAVQGRSRQSQLALAKKLRLTGFAAPGSSCILTDPQFSKRLLKMLKIQPRAKINDIALLGLGRHFWQDKTLFIVGRNHEENIKLKNLAQKGDFILEPQSFPGPLILVRSWEKMDQKQVLKEAKKLLLKYASHTPKKLSVEDFSLKKLSR